jgi:hypothetical protein
MGLGDCCNLIDAIQETGTNFSLLVASVSNNVLSKASQAE